MEEIELEKTYLAKYLPEGIFECEKRELLDIYVPEDVEFPRLRIRKKGSKFEITKKIPLSAGDASAHTEQTIPLDESEFEALSVVKSKQVHKFRYFYDYQGHRAEIDVFQDALSGLVLVDFEFKSVEEMKAFKIPDFCLEDVTQEDFIAGGMLCGKTYADIETNLRTFEYQRIVF